MALKSSRDARARRPRNAAKTPAGAVAPRTQQASLSDILDALTQGLAVFDAEHRLRYHNVRFTELMDFPAGFLHPGIPLVEIVTFNQGRGIKDHNRPDTPLTAIFDRMRSGAGPFRVELEVPDGHVLALRYSPLPDGGFLNTYTRITSRSHAEERARESLNLLQSVLDNMADGVRVFDSDLKLIAYNTQAFDMMNMPKELQRTGISYEALAEYARLRGDYDGEDEAGSMAERLNRAREARGRSSEHHLADGRVIQKRRNPMPRGGFVSTYSDITSLKKTEEKLAEKAHALETALEELRHSNTELEQFAYVASHDLQEPLRMVASYCQLLARRYGDKIGEDGKEFIGYAVDGAQRMQLLINDLLMYSRVGTRAKAPAPIALDEVLETVLQNLKIAIDESGGIVTRDALPVVMGDEVQMGQLLQNLIANALKFRRDVPPEIHVGAASDPAYWRISVADNGIGMEPAYFDRIFLIFQRLHERGKYPGTGIGLSVCKKIVERHGGTITVESVPGRGSTFTFSLPRHGVTS